jgi:hypothetical protein
LPHNQEKPRAAIFLPGYPFDSLTCMQKVAMPLSTAFGHLFFLVLSEAYLLTGKKKFQTLKLPDLIYYVRF